MSPLFKLRNHCSTFYTGCSTPGAGVPLVVSLVTWSLVHPLCLVACGVPHHNTCTQRGVSPMRRAACCIVCVNVMGDGVKPDDCV
jgi:hypothetical protein